LPDSGEPLERLVVAQDTGGAIQGAPRADYFCGSGPQAAELAGKMRQQGSLWLLWPRNVPLPAVPK
jgi:membrane-bound lytic murein transglycosylase A